MCENILILQKSLGFSEKIRNFGKGARNSLNPQLLSNVTLEG